VCFVKSKVVNIVYYDQGKVKSSSRDSMPPKLYDRYGGEQISPWE